jgi:hypothetical protein
MALQAGVCIANTQQLVVDGSVRFMTTGTSFAQSFVLEDKRPTLRNVAAQAAFIFGKKRGPAANVNGTFVRRVAIGAF